MKIEVYVDKAGEHRWRARADNGQIVATGGEGYKNQGDMFTTITRIQHELPHAVIMPVEE